MIPQKIEIQQWWRKINKKFMEQLKTPYKPVICSIIIGEKTFSVVYDGKGLIIENPFKKNVKERGT